MEQEKLYTVQEVADALRVTPRTVRRWIRTGAVRVTRPSGLPRGNMRIAGSEVLRMIAGLRPREEVTVG